MRRPILLLSSALLLTGCAGIEDFLGGLDKPTAKVTGVTMSDLSLDGVGLLFDVEVTNPYAVALPILGLDFGIGSGGQNLLTGSIAGGDPIASGGAATLQLPTQIDFAQLLAVLADVRPGAVVPYDLDAEVSVDAPVVGRLSLPIGKSGELPIPNVPEVSLDGVSFDDLSLTQAAATLAVRVGNTNDFPVDLRRMDYSLSLAGSRIIETSLAQSANLGDGDEALIEIPISFSPMNFGMAMFNVLTGEGAGYELGGTFEVETPFGAMDWPFQRSGQTSFTR